VASERNAAQDHELRGRIIAIDVSARIRLRVAQTSSLIEHGAGLRPSMSPPAMDEENPSHKQK
jgi:hypothetical protein